MPSTVEDILNQFRVPSVGPEHRNCRTGWVAIDCPFCGSSGKYHLGFPDQGLHGNCWRCGPHSLWDALVEITRDRQAVAEALADVRRDRLPLPRPASGRYRPPRGVGPLGPAHLSYLARRRVDGLQAAATWGIGGIGLAARLPWRLFLPVTRLGRPVSWTTRSLSKETARRYVSADPSEEDQPIKSLLYGEDLARNAVIVVEGPLDAIRVGPGAVATFGLNCTTAQLLKIAAFPLRVICRDNDEQAQALGRVLARQLAAFPGQTVCVQLESGTDPGSADPEELAELRQKFLE